MGRSLRWLRILVVVQWAAGLAGMAVASAYANVLPPALHGFESTSTLAFDSYLSSGFRLLALALAVGGSAGVVLAWPPARLAYTAGALLTIPTAVLQGHAVAHGHASPFYATSWLAHGTALALLWFSPAAQAFGAAPRALAMHSNDAIGRALRGAAMLAVGALAGLGALTIALVIAGSGYSILMYRAQAAAIAVGEDADYTACVTAALERSGEDGIDWLDGSFIATCLEVAERNEALCAIVPPLGQRDDWAHWIEAERWVGKHCSDEPDESACKAIYFTLQYYCHEAETQEGVGSDPSEPDSPAKDD
jgi:hypothetical protein